MLFQPSNVFGKHSNRDFLGSFAICFADVFLEVIGAPSLIWCGRHLFLMSLGFHLGSVEETNDFPVLISTLVFKMPVVFLCFFFH